MTRFRTKALLVWVVYGGGSLYLAWLLALRPWWVGTDTVNYVSRFDKISQCGCIDATVEIVFPILMLFVDRFGFGIEEFFFIVAVAQFFALYLSARNFSVASESSSAERNFFVAVFLAFLLVIPAFYSAQVNVIRQGLASLLLLAAISSALVNRKRSALGLMLLAVATHVSSIMFAAALITCLARFRVQAIVLVLLVIGYVTGLNERLVFYISTALPGNLYLFIDEYGATADYRRGVRIDFLLFSLFPLAVYGVCAATKRAWTQATHAKICIKIYIALLYPFLLFGWASFSDRYAFVAWLFMPVIAALFLANRRVRGSVLLGIMVLLGSLSFLYFRIATAG